jgi:plasmid stability protein
MPAFTIKNIPEELYGKLKDSALKNHRSINSEVIACIEGALSSQIIDPDEYLIGVRKLRETIKAPALTEDFLEKAKNEGRS